MTNITISTKELKMALKEGVREVFNEELMKLRALILPSVSQKEQKDIEKSYGRPSRKIAKSIEIEL